MIDDVVNCFICGEPLGCKHLERELRTFVFHRRVLAQATEPQDKEEKALAREYIARVVKHRRFKQAFAA